MLYLFIFISLLISLIFTLFQLLITNYLLSYFKAKELNRKPTKLEVLQRTRGTRDLRVQAVTVSSFNLFPI